jgi:hypothetical protein
MRSKRNNMNALKITLGFCANSEGAVGGNSVDREVTAG